jgi:hypothetical protein
MLRDLPFQCDSQMAVILSAIGGLAGRGGDPTPRRLSRGVYEISHFSLGDLIPSALLKEKYPEDFPCASYGVCDSPGQFLGKFGGLLLADEKTFVVSMTHVSKKDQSPEGGWRWHKWGPYVGEGKPTCEYLYDEPGFDDGVYVYHVYEVVPEQEGSGP